MLSEALSGCPAEASSAETSSGRKARHLWAHDKGGHFGTTGRFAATTVEGTTWLTEDTCTGTSVSVSEGVVAITELSTGNERIVHAGGSSTTGHKAAPQRSATPSPGPLQAVENYWKAINAHEYARAYDYLASGAINMTSEQFVAQERGYGVQSASFSGRVTSRNTASASVAVVRLVTRDRSFGCRDWSGSYALGRQSNQWRITRADVTARACT